MKKDSLKGWFKSGAPGVWISGGAVAMAVIMTVGLLAVIAVRGLGHFWPADLIQATYKVPGQGDHVIIGEVVQKEEVPRARLKGAGLPVPDEGPEFMTRELVKVGNRDLNGSDFTWVVGDWLADQQKPADLIALERREWGNFYGYLASVKEEDRVVAEGLRPGLSCRVVSSAPTSWPESCRASRRKTSVPSTMAWSVCAFTLASWSWTASWTLPPRRTWTPSVPNSTPATRPSKSA